MHGNKILYKQNNQPEPLLGSCRHAAVYFKHVPKPFQGRSEDKKYTGTWAECADKGNHHQLNRGNWNYLVEGVESDDSTTPVPRTISCQLFPARVAAATSDLIPLRGWFFMGFPCANPAPIQISQHSCPAVAVLFAWLWRRKGGQRKRSVRTWMPCSCSCHRFHRAVRGQNWSFRRHWTFSKVTASGSPSFPLLEHSLGEIGGSSIPGKGWFRDNIHKTGRLGYLVGIYIWSIRNPCKFDPVSVLPFLLLIFQNESRWKAFRGSHGVFCGMLEATHLMSFQTRWISVCFSICRNSTLLFRQTMKAAPRVFIELMEMWRLTHCPDIFLEALKELGVEQSLRLPEDRLQLPVIGW